jgi:2-isopropylmalate synthase
VPDDEVRTDATVRLSVQGRSITATGHGNGPVNALDTALHAALDPCFPALARLRLVDYRVRVLSGETGSSASARVLISYQDGARRWGTVGVDANTTAASWHALLDAVHYVLLDEPPGRERPTALGVTEPLEPFRL